MKNVVKILGIILMASMTFSMNAQTVKQQKKEEQKEIKAQKKEQKEVKSNLYKKTGKDAQKRAKVLKKAGWQTLGLPIEKQVEDMWMKQYEKDATGYPRYIVVSVKATANSFSAAQMMAENAAKIRIAGTIATNVTSLVDQEYANNQLSEIDAVSITKMVENSKNIVAQKLGRTIKVLEIYRPIRSNNNVEVSLTMVYDMRTAVSMASQTILSELKDDLAKNKAQLERLMGLDNLMDQCKNIIPDEIAE